jgi:uncharacterized protein (DUF3084 family)
MKKILILSTLISFVMICSCQKQDSTADQQLAQRKVELDTREEAVIEREKVVSEREKALDQREKALAQRERAAANARTIPPDAQLSDTLPDTAQAKAERDRKIQEIAAQFRAMIPDSSKMKAEKDRRTREQLSQKQPGLEKLQSQEQRKLGISGAAVSPAVEAASPAPSPAVEAASVTPSPTP